MEICITCGKLPGNYNCGFFFSSEWSIIKNTMENNQKLRVTQEYDKLSETIQEQVKLSYPSGFSQHLISFINKDGKTIKALRFETDDKIYLIRMSVLEAERIIEEDDDYDDDGELKDDIKEEYEDKHGDLDYIADEEEEYDDD